MRATHRPDRVEGMLGVVVAATIALPGLASCSSSSSPASKAQASANARASELGVTPIPDLAPGAHGPNGDITVPASNPPSKTSPGGSEVFPHVTQRQRKALGKHLVTFAGVRTVTYYPQFHQLQVYFTTAATSTDRQRVYRYVTQQDPAAAGTPGPSTGPRGTAAPSASAS